MEKIKVLYVTHESKSVLGATHSLVNMLHSVREFVEPTILFLDYVPAYDHVKGIGYDCIVVPFKLNILPKNFNYIKYIPRLIFDTMVNYRAKRILQKIVAERKIEIIHSNTSVLTIGYELAQMTNCKHVWHLREFQDLDFGFRPFLGWKHLKKRILLSDAVISISSAIETHFEMKNQPNSYVINNAVRSKKDIACEFPKKNVILFCGKVCEAKGAETALKIFAQFVASHTSYKLWLVGDVARDYENYLSNLAKELNIFDKIQFFYYQQNIQQYMVESAAFLMCSRNEAMGRVTVEAMFYGCPVIGYNSGGTKEIIQDGINGFLFSSIDEAVDKLEKLFKNDEIYKKIVSNAHETAINSFSEETYTDKLKLIYNKVLDRKTQK